MHLPQRGDETVANAPAREAAALVALVIVVGEPAGAAVVAGLLAADGQQRAAQQAVARGHAEQGPPSRRGGEAVEHGLDLVGGRVPGRDHAAALEREPGGDAVARVARPRLQVAGPLGPRDAIDPQRNAEPLAQGGDERLGPIRPRAQAVVDVQRTHAGGSAQRHGDVEQADRVAPAGDHRHHDHTLVGEPRGARGVEDRLDRALRGARARRRVAGAAIVAVAHGVAACARNSSVGSKKPFNRTSPMSSNPSAPFAASTTGRVTITSPPAARATTRAAWLTSRP